MAEFISQPDDEVRLGDHLVRLLTSGEWSEFRAAIAFVKRSGTKHIRDALGAFSKGKKVILSVGIDSGGTSAEGLRDLMSAVSPQGQIWIFHNRNRSTFHPKIYLFKRTGRAEVLVGSGNLTEGGLFTNYEAGVRIVLDLNDSVDRAFLTRVEKTLDQWCTKAGDLCFPLDPAFLQTLIDNRQVLPEALTRETEEASRSNGEDSSFQKKSPFKARAVRPAPRVEDEPRFARSARPLRASTPPGTTSPATAQAFAMTLQNTDVGYGQVTKGTSRRSPEIFIPIQAVDADPVFWGWPDKFSVDKKWAISHATWIAKRKSTQRRSTRPLEKMDRYGVRFRMPSGQVVEATVWYNPDKVDVRIRDERLRAAGNVNDILVLSTPPADANYDYQFEVVTPSDRLYAQLDAACNTRVAANSRKRYGYV